MVKYEEEYQEGKDLEKDTVETEVIHMSIQVGEVRIMGNEEGMAYMKKRMGRVGIVGGRGIGGT